ncbi:hypothetical protein CYMTET_52800 [Cymbomonas tetramitiformis]|uniref:Uncharacterized protein n=1 Tax=Cymbomonas tetramitiformis TaxID=36881 RepID=A0AAE0BIB9_9CHLO|nr:hypothetical protein CYMTET_52800 [Cymbomonas tetramitiformis]
MTCFEGQEAVQERCPTQMCACTGSPWQALTVARRTLTDPASELYTLPYATIGAVVNFPAALASVGSPPVSPGCQPGSNGTLATCGEEDAAMEHTAVDGVEVDVRVLVSREDPHGIEPEAFAVATSAMTEITLSAGAEVLQVESLSEAILFTLQVEQVQGAEGTERQSGSISGTMRCTFWNASLGLGAYSSQGCTQMPNPAPAGVSMYWRSRRVDELPAGLQSAWALERSNLTHECEETFNATWEIYSGADAGLRKYLQATGFEGGSDDSGATPPCALGRPFNSHGCWWNWTHQIFTGPSCVMAEELHCYCTHMTDFRAAQVSVDTLEPPKVLHIRASQLNLTLKDVRRGAILVTVVFTLMALAVYLAWASAAMHNQQRRNLLRELMKRHGTGQYSFHTIGGAWSWSLFEEDRSGAVQRTNQKKMRRRRQLRAYDIQQAATSKAMLRNRIENVTSNAKARLTNDERKEHEELVHGPWTKTENEDNPVPYHRKAAEWSIDEAALLNEDTNKGGNDSTVVAGFEACWREPFPRYIKEEWTVNETILSKMLVPGQPTSLSSACRDEDQLLPKSRTARHLLMQVTPEMEMEMEMGSVSGASSDALTGHKERRRGKPRRKQRKKSSDGQESDVGGDRAQGRHRWRQKEAPAAPKEQNAVCTEGDTAGLVPGTTAWTSEMAASPTNTGIAAQQGTGGPVAEALLPHDEAVVVPDVEPISAGSKTVRNLQLETGAPLQGEVAMEDLPNDSHDNRHALLRKEGAASKGSSYHPRRLFRNVFDVEMDPASIRIPAFQSKVEENNDEQQMAWLKQFVDLYSKGIQDIPSMKQAPYAEVRDVESSIEPEAVGATNVANDKPSTSLRPASSPDVAGVATAAFRRVQRVVTFARRASAERMIGDIGGSAPAPASAGSAGDSGEPNTFLAGMAAHIAQEEAEEEERRRHRRRTLTRFRKAGRSVYAARRFRKMPKLFDTLPKPLQKFVRRMGWTSFLHGDMKAPRPRPKVDHPRMQRLRIRLRSVGVIIGLYQEKQDLKHSHHLCSLLGLSLTSMQLRVPIQALRRMTEAKIGATGQPSQQRRPNFFFEPGSDYVSKANNTVQGYDISRKKFLVRKKEPLERMIGTAVVIAYLEVTRVVKEETLAAEVKRLAQVDWEIEGQTFKWYLDVFRTMVGTIHRRTGWFYRCIIWNLIFLQNHDGSFSLSPALATALAAGDTTDIINSDPTGHLRTGDMEDSTPDCLFAMCNSEEDAYTLWATLCVVARLKTLPFGWVINPLEPPHSRKTMASIAIQYTKHAFREARLSAQSIAEVKQAAADAVAKWTHERTEVIKTLQWCVEAQQSYVATAPLHTMEPPLTAWERRDEALQYLKALFLKSMRGHSWIRIAMVGKSEPFTRAQRILTEFTTILLMLTACFGFFYSKASMCCGEFRQMVCNGETDLNDVCEEKCIDLMEGEPFACVDFHCPPHEVYLPEGYQCTAFPQNTRTHKLWMALYVLLIVTPIRLFFGVLFRSGGIYRVPEHWDTGLGKKVSKYMGNGFVMLLERGIFIFYTLIFDQQRLSRAISYYLQPLLVLLDQIPLLLAKLMRPLVKGCRLLYAIAWLLFKIWVMKTEPRKALQDLELKWYLNEDRLLRQGQGANVLQQVRHEMDSLVTQLAYLLLLAAWAAVIFVLLVYGSLIRDSMGSHTETDVIQAWLLALLADVLVLQVLKSMTIKTGFRAVMLWIQPQGSEEERLALWFEEYMNAKLPSAYTSRMSDDEQEDADFEEP